MCAVDGARKHGKLRLRQRGDVTRILEALEADATEHESPERGHSVTEGSDHLANLAVSTLAQRDVEDLA